MIASGIVTKLSLFAVRVACLITLIATAGLSSPAWSNPVIAWREANERKIITEFFDFLSIPNIAAHPDGIRRNASFLSDGLTRRGFRTRSYSVGPSASPAIIGELKSPGATRTIIFYAHYDGQPATQHGWKSDPFVPTVRSGAEPGPALDWKTAAKINPEWRVFARSASDDKASIQALMSALDALSASGRKPSVNVKVFFEGDEEAGSPQLSEILRSEAAQLSGDLLIIGDGPEHQSGKTLLTFGARGLATLEMTTYGPARAVHSGHYGNWVPNPAVALVGLLAAIRDEHGRVLVPGYYDDVRPLTTSETAALSQLPEVERALGHELAIGRFELHSRLGNAVGAPAFNLRGLRFGEVGARASNAIFETASASIDLRFVPDQDPSRAKKQIEEFIRSRGWHIVRHEPSLEERRRHAKTIKLDWQLSYPGFRNDLDAPVATAMVRALERATGEKVLVAPMMGGSVPLALFAEHLKMPIIIVPVANHDNNQHAANENLRLRNLWDGIEIYAALLTELKW